MRKRIFKYENCYNRLFFQTTDNNNNKRQKAKKSDENKLLKKIQIVGRNIGAKKGK